MDSSQPQPPPEVRLHFLDYWRIIRIRKAIIITVFLITAIIATMVTFILPVSYSSTAQISIEPDNSSDLTSMTGMSSPESRYDAYYLQTQLALLEGPSILNGVIDTLHLNEVWGKKYGVGVLKSSETLVFLQHQLSISPVRNTTLVDITVYSGDKSEAATIANAVANAYKEYRRDQLTQMTEGGIKTLEASYQTEEEQIKAVQGKVDTLRRDLKITDTDPQNFFPSPTMPQEQLRQYHDMMMASQMRYNRLNEQLAQLKALPPNTLRDALPPINPDAVLSDLLNKLNVAQQQFVTMTNDYSLVHPDVVRVQSMIAVVNRQIDSHVSGVMIAMENNLSTEKATLDTLKSEVDSAIEKDREGAVNSQPYWETKRKLANLYEMHRILASKIELSKIDMGIPKTKAVKITEIAEPGKNPVRPNKPLNITLGLVFGLIVGVGLAFFIEYLDTSVKTIDDVERAFQASVLGVIPQNVGILMDEGPESRYAEAYRVLRTNILFARKDDKLTSVVVVSAGAGEGKSTTTLNLATVFAQAGQRILVVDSDLRRPTLHKLMHVANDIGLTNYLLKQNTLEEVIQTTEVPLLNFMSSGKLPSSSMSVLNSMQMKQMIADLKQRYDFVFFDSPPILGVSDASVLASEVDMVVQVVQYRRYPQPMNLRAKQVIEKIGGTFLGIVLNNINMSQDESYYYYSGYYQETYQAEVVKNQVAAASTDSTGADNPGIKQKY